MIGEALALLALILFSTNIILTKVATARVNSNLGFLISVSVNVLFAALLLLIQFIFFDLGTIGWDTKGFFLFLAAGFFSTYLGRWFFFETIAKLGPTRASAFQVSNPLFTTIIAWGFLEEKLDSTDLSAIFLMLLGLFLVSYISKRAGDEEVAATQEMIKSRTFKQFVVGQLIQTGILLAFLSSFFYAIGNIVRGVAIQSWNQPILGGLLGALLGFLLHVITNKSTRHFWSEIKKSDRTGVTFYMISGAITISAQIAVIASMRYIPISIANLITLSTPIIVTPVSYFLFKNQEGITYKTIIGIVLVMSGLCLIIL
ncbi:DMT family transporter [Niallia endozanthoxylica]|uniref:DMT family transporter n=1 Tax=Niallia endozanthoxylica TaxID=2036016 RepID=A0A5J5GU83_9BACI|nr:DMT family transporter [Niallia endozanthoxylica]KAA9011183.1 DMT family transporter [Niallia endozanthoxylica]